MALPVGEGVLRALGASEPVTEGEAPLERVAAGLPEMEGLGLAVGEGLPVPEPLTVTL